MRLLVLAALLLASFAHAGGLDRFEDAASSSSSKPAKPAPRPPAPKPPAHWDDDGSFVADLIFAILFGGNDDDDDGDDEDDGMGAFGYFFRSIYLGGAHSVQRYHPELFDYEEEEEKPLGVNRLKPRTIGEPLIPIVRLDSSYSYESSDIEEYDVRLELGYGCVAVDIRNSDFSEGDPKDHLNLMSYHLIYRMTWHETFQTDFGWGLARLRGDGETTGKSVTFGFLLHPTDWLGIEYRPTFTKFENSIEEHDVALMLRYENVSLKLGHRWFEVEEELLQGPYLGVAVHF